MNKKAKKEASWNQDSTVHSKVLSILVYNLINKLEEKIIPLSLSKFKECFTEKTP